MTEIVAMPLSVRDLDRFTPPGAEGEGAPVYLVRPASYLQRAAWMRDVAAAGATWPADGAIYAAMESAVEAAGPDNAGELVEIVRAIADGGANAVRDQRVRFNALLAHLQGLDPAIGTLLGAREHYQLVAPWWAARRFLVGWENVALAFARRQDLVPEALLEQLPRDHIAAIGVRAMQLMAPTEIARKNS